nr:MAG TPA: hypothetical protein [Caudoviricetes sp.]
MNYEDVLNQYGFNSYKFFFGKSNVVTSEISLI